MCQVFIWFFYVLTIFSVKLTVETAGYTMITYYLVF